MNSLPSIARVMRRKNFNGYVSTCEIMSWIILTVSIIYGFLYFTLPHKLTFIEKIILNSLSLGILLLNTGALNLTKKRIQNLEKNYIAVLGILGVLPWSLFVWQDDWNAILLLSHICLIPLVITNLKGELGLHLVPKSLKIFLISLCIGVMLNTLTCFWLLIYPSAEDNVTAYIEGFYWLITTLTTIGYGDIVPTTNGGRIFTIFVMILGATSFGMIVASFARLMAASDKRTELKNDKLKSLAELFKHYEIPKNLQNQAVGFCHHLYSQKIFADEEAVLQELPPPLRDELEIYMNIKPISKIVIFRGSSIDCLKHIAKQLTQEFYEPGNKIITRGDIGDEMFLIGHGSVGIVVNGKKVATLEHGQCFGEVALLEKTTRTADVIAESYCSMFKLSRSSFEGTILLFPDLKKNVDQIINSRRENINSGAGNLRKQRRRTP